MSVTYTGEDQLTAKLIRHWEQVCRNVEELAKALPEQSFHYRPADTVRTVAELLRHVAFWNQYVADRARGNKGDDSTNEIPKEKFLTKAQIMNALKGSAVEASDALREKSSAMSEDIAEMLVTFIEHNCEHYGQLAVYARMNGIVPPRSRA